MITIIYSTHKDENYNNKFRQHLLQSVGLKDVQILEYINHNQYSLAEVYNRGTNESIFDIVVCCHNDIKLEKGWGKKLLSDFKENPEYGIIGKAGSCYFPESGIYWDKMTQTMVGQVYHHPEPSKKWLSRYSPKIPFLIPVVTVDGLFISFDKTKIKHNFDESFGRFHFYDHGFAVPNYLDGVKIGVTSSFEITHESVGQPNKEFFESKEIFLQKYGDKLPLDLKPEKVWTPNIKRFYPRKYGKVGIIIPTKGKVHMLYKCVKSYYDHCDPSRFKIFIADTGSSKEDIEWIKENILPLGNIQLIEYDYYNFAKINNDVVINHINNDFEFILFSNNDITLLNDVISGMVGQFNSDPRTGTVGARLHYENNTLQHDGVNLVINSETKAFMAIHHSAKNYYNFNVGNKKMFGTTGALLMIRKSTFEKVGMFNQNYEECFEDVELNIQTLKLGMFNYLCGDCVAYHSESPTRNQDPTQRDRIERDANRLLEIYKIHNKLLKPYTGIAFN